MAMGQVTAGGTVARMGAAGAGALIMLVVPIGRLYAQPVPGTRNHELIRN